jgi:23S rRNA (adenine1618-N6)-methyltransferase
MFVCTNLSYYLSNNESSGVGASCIYPLLGCSMRQQWQFHGTEIDETNITWARKNVTLNDMASRIQVHPNTATGNILQLDAMGIECADFTMCNPPFYKSKEDMQRSLTKDTPPSAVCTGADVEMITEGGDAGFAVRIVEESKGFGERVQWYTCMLGKLSSLAVVVEKLRELSCQNWAIGCLVPGNKTRRWVVGWSWSDLRPTSVSIRFDELSSRQ